MNDNVVALPVQRKPGRPRLHPARGTAPGQVLPIAPRTATREGDARADFERLLDQISVHLLAIVEIIQAHDKKHCQ